MWQSVSRTHQYLLFCDLRHINSPCSSKSMRGLSRLDDADAMTLLQQHSPDLPAGFNCLFCCLLRRLMQWPTLHMSRPVLFNGLLSTCRPVVCLLRHLRLLCLHTSGQLCCWPSISVAKEIRLHTYPLTIHIYNNYY